MMEYQKITNSSDNTPNQATKPTNQLQTQKHLQHQITLTKG